MDTDLDGMIKDEKDVHLEGETMSLISNKIRFFLIQWSDSSFDGDPFSPASEHVIHLNYFLGHS